MSKPTILSSIKLESYISLCDKHKQLVMLVLAYEEDLPYGDTFVPKALGKQKMYYNHFNRDYELQDEIGRKGLFKHYTEYEELKPIFMTMVKTVVKKYRNDNRVFCWNVENEPGITIGDRAVTLLEDLFAIVREQNPIQPLCADIWRGLDENGGFKSKVEEVAYNLSDVISYHNYSDYEAFVTEIYKLKQHSNRPILVTEWLHRCTGNSVQAIYPFLMVENLGAYCWGFVAGGTMTVEPWYSCWQQYKNNPDMKFDFTKWQHDLYRINYSPYDPREIDVIKRMNALADKKFIYKDGK